MLASTSMSKQASTHATSLLRWAKSRDSNRRFDAASLARVSAMIGITIVHWRSYLSRTQTLVLRDPVFFALRFESYDWGACVKTFVPWNWQQELTAFAER